MRRLPLALLLLHTIAGTACAQRDVVVEVVDRTTALAPDDRQAKLEKLADSPFVFFRGTAHLFWADLGQDPRLGRFGGSPDTCAWVLGDAHPENVGTFGHAAIVYDLDDFDEAVVADFQLDLWRMAVGVELVGRANEISVVGRRQAVEALARAYVETLASCSGVGNDRELRSGVSPRRDLGAFVRKVAAKRDRARLLRKWTDVDAGQRLLAHKKLEDVSAAQASELTASIARYATRLPGQWPRGYFLVKSAARRLDAGTGSLGSDRFYVLVEGPSASLDDDLILDVKAQGTPAAAPYLMPADQAWLAASFPHEAARVAAAERALLGPDRVDPHVGWLELARGPCTVRQRSPFKDTYDTEDLRSRSQLRDASALWGQALAFAHARADQDLVPTLVPHSVDDAVFSRVRHERASFARLVAEVASEYADQVEEDHRDLADHLAATR